MTGALAGGTLAPLAALASGAAARSADACRRFPTGAAAASPLPALLADRVGAVVGLRCSSHALDRSERRGIPLDEQALTRLEGGVDRAAAKGSHDSLVMVDSTAVVVSVRNRTVVTALDRQHAQEHVFTNIDSAVIA